MGAKTPEDLDRMFAEAVAAGDAGAIAALYEPGGALVGPDGVPVIGQALIRDAIGPMAEAKPKVTMNVTKSLIAGDIAVLYNDWSARMAGPDGNAVDMAGKAIEVCRRQSDGSWLFVIDDPTARG
jgi:uncharacterized protein (TIGR02246 family)